MATRTKLIQLIHIGAAKLHADDDGRRRWQKSHTGKTSCKDMTDKELEYLVKLLRDAGAITKRVPKRAGRVPFNRSPYMSKIGAQLADMKLSWQYAEAIAWRLTGGLGKHTEGRPGVQRLEFVKKRQHFEGIIAALKKEQDKRKLLAGIEQMLADLKLKTDYVEELIYGRAQASKWQRNLPLLKSVSEHLYNMWEHLDAAK